MSLSEVQVAQIRLCNARERAKMLGDDARRQYMVYLAAKKVWLAEVDRIDVLDRAVDEKVAIERAFAERASDKARGKNPDDEA
jgi:hypothetical protein